METRSVSTSPDYLWSSFYTAFLGEISRFFPLISQEHELHLLSKFERIWGAELYLRILPSFGKMLEVALATGTAEIPHQKASEHDSYFLSNGLPRLLNELWTKILSPSKDGRMVHCRFDVRDIADVRKCDISLIVTLLRQFTLAFSKVTDVEPDVDSDEEIKLFAERITNPAQPCADRRELEMVRAVIRVIVQADPYDTDDNAELCAPLAQWENDPFGKHGPGAVAGGETGSAKWDFNAIAGVDPEMYEYFPADFLAALCASDNPLLARLTRIVKDPIERISRLSVVPKDFRGHRLICIEPKELQFAQQGLMHVLYEHIMSHWLTRRSIDFVDQTKSMRMSRHLRMATLDLKDASDRFSMRLGRLIFPRRFFELMTRYRSTHIELEDGSLIASDIVATMGSALCFPLETLVFYAIALSAMLIRRGCFPPILLDVDSSSVLKRLPLRVFGDDIIVSRDDASCVVSLLEKCGFVVNAGKTCITGLAREACGSWYYAQDDVRIVRFKTCRLNSSAQWVALAEQAKALLANGFTRTSRSICEFISDFHPVPWGFNGFPYRVNAKTGGRSLQEMGESSERANSPFYRWNNDYQRLEFRMPVRSTRPTRTEYPHSIDGLYAFFTDSATHTLTLRESNKIEWVWAELLMTSGSR